MFILTFIFICTSRTWTLRVSPAHCTLSRKGRHYFKPVVLGKQVIGRNFNLSTINFNFQYKVFGCMCLKLNDILTKVGTLTLARNI